MFAELLLVKLAGICQLSATQVQRLEAHFALLQHWNRVINLTSIRKAEEIVERHYCESLFLGVHLPPGPLQIADIGSGAGFPGVPVAILRPECTITLIESHQRKAVFLRESTRELANVTVLAKRTESVAYHYDWVISRAVRLGNLAGLGAGAALLTGEMSRDDLPTFEWSVPIRLPWGSNRFLWLGRNVSRETVLA